jgi:uncharacterized protein YdaU (DUF1376 family)
MSRAWIAFYIGDYLKDTQALTTEQHGAYLLLLMECWQKGRLPPDAASRAAIARLPLSRWNKIGAPVDAFFASDGTNKRATAEIAKAEAISLKRAIAGAAGGHRSGVAKAVARGERAKREASALPRPWQTARQNPGNGKANQNPESSSASPDAALASPPEIFFVIFDTPEWHAHQAHRARHALPPLEPVTILRDGTAYRGARVSSAVPTPDDRRQDGHCAW